MVPIVLNHIGCRTLDFLLYGGMDLKRAAPVNMIAACLPCMVCTYGVTSCECVPHCLPVSTGHWSAA